MENSKQTFVSNINYKEMIREIDEYGEGLTDWEIEFIGNLVTNLEDTNFYTAKQRDKIENIHYHKVNR